MKRIVSKHFGHPIMILSVASRQPKSSTNNVDNEDDKEHNSDASFNTAKSSADKNDDDTGTVDKLFQDLLTERNVDDFACL